MMDDKTPVSDVDRLDKACDAVVYAIGSIAKLGLDHHGITKALNIVNAANKAKLGMPRDEHGKLLKPDNFVGPEAQLQELLDSYKG
jgi:predicted HAD superfamily Cof-like phosphohydrolase